MKKLIAMVLLAAALLSLGAVFADNNYYYYKVTGNDGDVQYLAYLGDNVWVNCDGVHFRPTGVNGEYVSDYSCYFHDANYVPGSGHEYMPYAGYTKVTGNDGDVHYIYCAGGNVWYDTNGYRFEKNHVKGEYVSQYGCYFHDSSYVRGTGTEKMPAANAFRVAGNDGDIHYISYAGNNLWKDANGICFYASGVTGEYLSQYGCYFHAAGYVNGSGHEYMPV